MKRTVEVFSQGRVYMDGKPVDDVVSINSKLGETATITLGIYQLDFTPGSGPTNTVDAPWSGSSLLLGMYHDGKFSYQVYTELMRRFCPDAVPSPPSPVPGKPPVI